MNHLSPSPVSRREFLGRSTIGAAGLVFGFGLVSAARADSARKIPFGVQLYSLREQCKTDLPGMIALVSQIGFKGVEFAGYFGHGAKELRQVLDDHGIVACGTHAPFETVTGDKLKATIEFNHTIGNKFIIIPWLEGTTKQAWLDLAATCNDIADRLKPEGLFLGYHSHKHDFAKFDGEYSWDIFLDHTKSEIIAQVDVANCRDGNADPLTEMRKRPDRLRTMHIKAYGAGPEAVIGEDDTDWKGIFEFCETKGGTDWYVLEHETSKEPVAAVKRSYESLKKLGKV